MSNSVSQRVLATLSAAALLAVATPYSASANDLFKSVVRHLLVIPHVREHRPHVSREPQVERRSRGTPERGPAKSKQDSEFALAALGNTSSFDVVLKTVTLKSVSSTTGHDDSDVIGVTRSDDGKRDLQSRMEDFIKSIVDGQTTAQAGDVNQVAVEQALEDAYNEARLEQFEEFQGENLTRDRLKVAIIDNTYLELSKLKNGNNFGLVKMVDLRRLIGASAKLVYRQTFETCELLAMNQRVVDFGLYAWEHSDSDRSDYRPYSTADLIRSAQATFRAANEPDKSATPAVTPPPKSERQMATAMEYRGMRVAIDCFSHHVRSELESTNDLGQKIDDLAHGACKATVKAFLQSADATKPEGRRAIWSIERSAWADVANQASRSN